MKKEKEPNLKPSEDKSSDPKIVKMVGLTPDTARSLSEYLASKPYQEVAGLISAVNNGIMIDVSIQDGK